MPEPKQTVPAQPPGALFGREIQACPDRLAIRHPTGDESASASIPHPVGGELPSSEISYPTGRKLKLPKKGHPAGSQSLEAFSPQLTLSHYRALMQVTNLAARDFYEPEARP